MILKYKMDKWGGLEKVLHALFQSLHVARVQKIYSKNLKMDRTLNAVVRASFV
jgi:hypothetical protein